MYASVVLPTYNERESLPRAIAAVRQALAGREDWEVIIVDDDSPDRTWELAQELGASDARIRCYRRVDRRGLSSAIIDGLSLGTGERLLVMDADLQHDATKIPALLAALDDADIASGTRYADGGSTGQWSRRRLALSKLATVACRLVLGIRASDPMSGFFAIRRQAFMAVAPRLNPRGYKIFMELLHVLRPARVGEVPYVFSPRVAGVSKLSGQVIWDFALSLAELFTRRLISARFLKYALVGLSGVAVQYAAFFLIWRQMVGDEVGTALAIACAALSNYLCNNSWTFHDRAHRSFADMTRGVVLFLAISGTGALINQSVTWYLHDKRALMLSLAMAAGIVVATVWNYYLNLDLTWRGHARPE
jgi:dolichol-phosphate mannosyltransferase